VARCEAATEAPLGPSVTESLAAGETGTGSTRPSPGSKQVESVPPRHRFRRGRSYYGAQGCAPCHNLCSRSNSGRPCWRAIVTSVSQAIGSLRFSSSACRGLACEPFIHWTRLWTE
jgi:hypothetical protein